MFFCCSFTSEQNREVCCCFHKQPIEILIIIIDIMLLLLLLLLESHCTLSFSIILLLFVIEDCSIYHHNKIWLNERWFYQHVWYHWNSLDNVYNTKTSQLVGNHNTSCFLSLFDDDEMMLALCLPAAVIQFSHAKEVQIIPSMA